MALAKVEQVKAEKLSVARLLASYNADILQVRKLLFTGVDGKDVYNITAPFTVNGVEYVAGRVESRGSETDSKVMFFARQGKDEHSKTYALDRRAPVFEMQDPFFSVIDNEFVFGGVKVFFEGGSTNFKTVFYRGSDIFNLKEFAEGPVGMKDIRIFKSKGHTYLFTRPQGEIGGRGRIGFMELGSIDDLPRLNDADYLSAELLDLPFVDEGWLGTNEILELENGNIGVLGHVACFSGDQRNYYPITFEFDPITREVRDMEIIATRLDLPTGPSKRLDLVNVLFPGGIVRLGNGTAILYVGASDVESYEITIRDSFWDKKAAASVGRS